MVGSSNFEMAAIVNPTRGATGRIASINLRPWALTFIDNAHVMQMSTSQNRCLSYPLSRLLGEFVENRRMAQ
jgi:hypothetical protein